MKEKISTDKMKKYLKSFLVQIEECFGRNVAPIMFEKGKKMIFIIGHMRCGSSLLVHILSSKSNIVGYGETHVQYRNRNDFGVTAVKVCRKTKRFPIKSNYFLDKVLHSELFDNIDMLNHSSVRIIFQMRRPDHALSSIVRNTNKNTPEEACSYYLNQINWIDKISKNTSNSEWIKIKYEDLIYDTKQTFRRIENLLGIKDKLEESYRISKFTGKPGVGDPGPNIYEGKIKRNIDYEVEPSVRPFVNECERKLSECIKKEN